MPELSQTPVIKPNKKAEPVTTLFLNDVEIHFDALTDTVSTKNNINSSLSIVSGINAKSHLHQVTAIANPTTYDLGKMAIYSTYRSLIPGDLLINGIDIVPNVDEISYTQQLISQINALSGLTGVTASTPDGEQINFSVEDEADVNIKTGDNGELEINGIQITPMPENISPVQYIVNAINDSTHMTGVMASISDNESLQLIAYDGRNIHLSHQSTSQAGIDFEHFALMGEPHEVIARGDFQLVSPDNTPIDIQGSHLEAIGLKATSRVTNSIKKTEQVTTLYLNGIDIQFDSSTDTFSTKDNTNSSLAIVSGINAKSHLHQFTAITSPTTYDLGHMTIYSTYKSLTVGDLIINGVCIIPEVDEISFQKQLISQINCFSHLTGAYASTPDGQQLNISSYDERDVDIKTGDNGELIINGIEITSIPENISPIQHIVNSINSSTHLTGVIASTSDNASLQLIAYDGRNIHLSHQSTSQAGIDFEHFSLMGEPNETVARGGFQLIPPTNIPIDIQGSHLEAIGLSATPKVTHSFEDTIWEGSSETLMFSTLSKREGDAYSLAKTDTAQVEACEYLLDSNLRLQ